MRVPRTMLLLFVGATTVASGLVSPAGAASIVQPGPTTLRVSLQGTFAGCDPVSHAVSSATQQVLSLVLPSAYTSSPDGTVAQAESILTQAEVVDLSPLTIDYQLRSGVTWSNGIPIGLRDFIATWHIGALGNAPAAPQYRLIRSIKAGLSPHQVVVTFSSPDSSWQSLFSPLLPASVPARALETCALPSATLDLSAGPYQIAAATSSQMFLVRNPRWTGRQPIFNTIVVTGGATPFAASRADPSIAGFTEQTWFTSLALSGLTSNPNTHSTTDVSNRLLSVNFDTTSGVTKARSVRRAIEDLIDRSAIVTATVGAVDPSIEVASSPLLSQGQPGYSGSAPPSVSPQTSTKQADETPGASSVERRSAASLLRRAGLRLVAGSWRSARGHLTTLTMSVDRDDGWALEVAPMIVDQLVSAHLVVHERLLSGAAAVAQSLTAGTSNLGLFARPTDPFIGHAVAWFSIPKTGPASALWSGFSDHHISALANQARMIMNPMSASPLYQQISQDLWNTLPSLPVFTEPMVTVWSSSIDGVTGNPYPPGTLEAVPTWESTVGVGS